MSEEETVTLKVPKGVIELLKCLGRSPEDYFMQLIKQELKTDLQELRGCRACLIDFEKLLEKYKLEKFLGEV